MSPWRPFHGFASAVPDTLEVVRGARSPLAWTVRARPAAPAPLPPPERCRIRITAACWTGGLERSVGDIVDALVEDARTLVSIGRAQFC